MVVAQFPIKPATELPASAAYPQLARALWQWLAVGALLLLALPAARGDSAWFGPVSFWLLGAPLASLLTLYRQVLAAAWRGVLVPAPRRRRSRGASQQARRMARVPALPGIRRHAA